jgi:nitrite reductase/ring-hydroxylating ferredoxin subunit
MAGEKAGRYSHLAEGGGFALDLAVQGARMPEVFVAKATDLPDGERRIVEHAGEEIGVFHWQGAFYAYRNLCVHQGGPACEGIIMHKVEDVLGPDRTWHGQKFSDEVHFVCPWHGYEYDLKTGECAADRRLRLKTYPVVRRGEDIYVVA